jgi:hypothetical protein
VSARDHGGNLEQAMWRAAELETLARQYYLARQLGEPVVLPDDEIERLIAEVCSHPQAFRRVRGEIRRHFTATFPYGILFEDRPEVVRILAVMPLHRDPDYWLHRQTN